MRSLFNCEVGLSDHTLGIGVAIASVTMGASIIEKHFMLSKKEGGLDASFSLDPKEFSKLVKEVKAAYLASGEISYGPTEDEKNARSRRRSIYISQDIKAGEIITQSNIKRIRPGLGLHPKYYQLLLGRKTKKDVKKGTPASWDLF